MNREFATLLTKKLYKRAGELHNDADAESNAFISSYLLGQATALREVCKVVIETFNELEEKK